MSGRKSLITIINGEPHMSSAGVFLACASVAYGHEPAAEPGRVRGRAIVEALLQEMRAGAFAKADILETILAASTDSDRAVDMAIEAIDHIGNEAFFRAMQAAGIKTVVARANDEGPK